MLKKRQVAIGVIFWVLIFGAFITLAGIGEFVDSLAAISARELATILAAVGVGVVSMGSVLYVFGRSLDLGYSLVGAIFLNTSVSLAHNLTPFGQAGGVPIGAAILSKRTERPYEECLAALSAKDIVSFVPAILVFIVGGSYITVYGQEVPGELRPLFAAFALAVFIVCSTVLGVYRFPSFTFRVLQRLVNFLNRSVARLPLIPSLDENELEERLLNFTDSLAELASDRLTVVAASTLATTAFVAQGTLLWLTLGAIGVNIPAPLAIFIVPVSLLAAGLPLPGGSGGVESVQILMILATTGAASSQTITAVVLSRGLVYWTPIVLGSVTLFVLQIQDVKAGKAH